MRQQKKHNTFFAIAAAAVISLAVSAQTTQQTPEVPAKYKQAVATFEQHVKDYVKLREGLEDKLPKLPQDSKPEQIEAHKVSFQETVRTARTGAKHGDVFSPSVAEYIRATIRDRVQGAREAGVAPDRLSRPRRKGVTVRVNYPYPESKELVEMPPTLLLRLPQLPKQVRYRFVGRNLLLVDRENGLIIDYMPNALP